MTESAILPIGEELTEEALYTILDSLSQVQQYKAIVYLSVLWAEHQDRDKGGTTHGRTVS